MPTLTGWIFDVYPSPTEMTVWVIDDAGDAHRLADTLTASFFVAGSRPELHAVCQLVRAARLPVTLHRARRYDIFSRGEIELLEVAVSDPARFPLMVQFVARHFPDLALYNSDVPLEQVYMYERGLFPLARVQAEIDSAKRIRAIETRDSPWALDYALPPLRIMTLRLEGDAINPNHTRQSRPLEIGVEGTTHVLVDDDPREMLERVKGLLEQHDPHIVVSAYGDSFILPRLLEMAQRHRVRLPFNRDPRRAVQYRKARSYFSYGRIVYKTASHTLFGRWHIDLDNAFLLDDYSLDGVFELSRISRIPVQRTARVSTGTCVSAMEMATAYGQKILIPSTKREPEAFKSADQFVTADKGGLVFQPVVGLHEQVAEFDFASMFPSIMEKFNLSAETLNCACCRHHRVPELGYWVCTRRRGLIPETIAPLIAKRLDYKRRARELADGAQKETYQRRVSCLKWALVTVFGYTGYRNARFGKIEAHEAINAYGRDALLIAKEMAELRGFRMLHAIVDALYLQKNNARDEEYIELARAVSQATKLPIELEGVFDWIAFLPSRQDAHLGVANRYFGAYRDGKLKVRGIQMRRSDTPPFIRHAQDEMIHALAGAKNRAGLRSRVGQVIGLMAGYLDLLYAGQVPFDQLVVTQHLSHSPTEYTKNNLNAVVAKALLEQGVSLSPGEAIRYVIIEQKAKRPGDRARALEHMEGSFGYDADRYAQFLMQAVESLLVPLKIEYPQIEAWAKQGIGKSSKPLELPPPQKSFGPLFEWAARRVKPEYATVDMR